MTPTKPMPTSPRPKVRTNSRSTSPIPMLCEIDSSVRPEIPHSSSSAPTIRQTVKPVESGDLLMSRLMTPRPSASSKLGKDVPANINDGPGLQSPSGTNENLLSLLNSTEGLRCSTRTNIQFADGISTADEDMTKQSYAKGCHPKFG